MAEIKALKMELLNHTPHPADLAYFLFPNLTNWLGGKRFDNYGEVNSAVAGYLEEPEMQNYTKEIEKTRTEPGSI